MKRLPLLILILLLGFSGLLKAQTLHQDESFTLNTEITGSHIYEARDFVKMEPGFHYQATGTESFRAKTNPYLVFPPEGGETGGPDPEDDGVVGDFAGSATVAPNGSAEYNLPIPLPKGTGNIKPNLSLYYSSSSGNNDLGMGWSLGGISSIAKTSTTIYHDGIVDGIDYDDNDKYSLNGQRLIAINGEYGSDMTEYRTEAESFTKIISHNSENLDDPDFFQGYTKNGLIHEFGKTGDSRVESTENAPHFIQCYINKTEDRNGNTINYEYEEVNNHSRIKKISYSQVEVIFNYIDRTYSDSYYLYGDKIEVTKKLGSVIVKNNGEILNRYVFEYNTTSLSEYLSDIKLYGKDNNSHFNPISFTWGSITDDFDFQNTNLYNDNLLFDKVFGDYNGDGKTDAIKRYFDYDEEGNKVYGNEALCISSVNGTYFEEHVFHYNSLQFGVVPAGDINGDGKANIIRTEYNKETVVTGDGEYVIHFGKYYLQSFDGTNIQTDAIKEYNGLDRYYRVADLTGNKRNEFIVMRWSEVLGPDNIINFIPKIIAYEYLNESNSWQVLFEYEYSDFNAMNEVEVADFNNDGKSELLINTSENTSAIFEYDGDNSLVMVGEEKNYPTSDHVVHLGDFNGDGSTDILTRDLSQNQWELKHFDGKNQWISGNCQLLISSSNRIQIADFNGDGKDDILEAYMSVNIEEENRASESDLPELIQLGDEPPIPDGTTQYKVYYSNGNDFVLESALLEEEGLPYINRIISRYDFNGDGKDDCFIERINEEAEYPKSIVFFHKDEKRHLLTNVNNALNHTTRFNYETLSQGEFYTPHNDEDNTVKDFQSPLYVCHTLQFSNGLGNYQTREYEYEGAKYHNEGKGFLGFKKTTITDASTGRKYETINKYDNAFFFMYPDENRIYIGDQLIKSTKYYNKIKNFGNKRYFSYIEKLLRKERDLDGTYIRTIKKEKHYSETDIEYGNLTWKKEYFDKKEIGIDDEFTYVNMMEYQYAEPDPESWIIGLVEVKTTTKSRPENEDHVRIKNYTYEDGYNPLLKKTWNTPPAGEEKMKKVHTYGYDAVGNISSLTVETPNDPNTKTIVENYEYDSEYDYRYLTRKWQTAERKTFEQTYTYYPLTGKRKTATDINGLTTKYFYDSFGRLTKTEYPHGVNEVTVLRWVEEGDPDTPPNATYYSWTATSGQDPVKIYYDILKRKIRIVSHTFDGTKRYQGLVYNAVGKKEKISLPYIPGEAETWTSFVYDDMLRKISIIDPNSTIDIDYSGRVIRQENDATHEFTEKTTNALGQQIKVVENGGEIDYQYYSSGMVKNTTANGSTIEMDYDNLGNKIYMNDPSLGIYTYDYNALSLNSQQTNPKNVTESYKYDKLGRIVEINNDEEGIISYSYDKAENGMGKLFEVKQYKNDISKHLRYDEFSRLESVTEFIDEKEFITIFGYDMIGRQNKTIYPSGFEVNKEIDGNGYVSSILTSHSPDNYLEGLKYNVFDQLTEYNTVNGKTTNFAYDQYGLPDYFYTQGVMDQNYTFDYTWNRLLNREDNYKDNYNVESFKYDSDDRLTSTTTNGSNEDFKYEDNGNLMLKSSVGTFQYGEKFPEGEENPAHALTSARFNQDVSYHSDQEITYTAFDKISTINEGDYNYEVTYGPGRTRKKSVLKRNGNMVKTKFYAGTGYEMELYANGLVRELHYIEGAVFVKRSDEKDSLYYTYTDYQGSLQAVTDEQGNVVERLSFGPWGQHRNPDDWRSQEISSSHIFDRGYTGHEHLDQFGLINMNGRVYDPQLGRFLSPDPFITSPGNPQNYNRYSYVLNNPMRYTDPSGYSVQPHPDDENWSNSPVYHDITSNLGMSGIDWRSGFWGRDLHFMFLSVSDYEYLYGEGSYGIYLMNNGYLPKDRSNYKKKDTEEYGESKWVGLASNANWLSGINVVAGPDFQNEIDVSLAQLKAKLAANGGGLDATDVAAKGATGFGLANAFRYRLEWEYVKQARINRALSGNFSQPIKHSLRSIKSTGRVLGYTGIAISGVDIAVNGVNVSNSLDIVMGGIAFIPGIGWAVSGTYFLVNITTQLGTGQSLGEHIQGQFINPDASFKPW